MGFAAVLIALFAAQVTGVVAARRDRRRLSQEAA